MAKRVWRRPVGLLSAITLAAIVSTPVYAVGFCNPGRPSSAEVRSVYATKTAGVGEAYDLVRAELRDMDPYVESGRNYAFVELFDFSDFALKVAQFGWYINFAGARKIFAFVTDG